MRDWILGKRQLSHLMVWLILAKLVRRINANHCIAFNAENILGLKFKLINTMTYVCGYMIICCMHTTNDMIERNHKIFDRVFSQQF